MFIASTVDTSGAVKRSGIKLDDRRLAGLPLLLTAMSSLSAGAINMPLLTEWMSEF